MIAPKNSVATKQNTAPAAPQKPQSRLMDLLKGKDMLDRLHALMTEKSMLDRFIGVFTGVLKANPKLAECTEASLVGAMLKSAFLRLEPNNPITQQCWFIPRWNSKLNVMECSWEAGWKGLIELAYRTGQVKAVRCEVIHERDYFDIDFGLKQVIHKLPQTDRFNRGPVVGYWAQWIGADPNQSDIRLMTSADMQHHVDQYVQSLKDEKSAKYSPWTTAYDEMARKTVIKKVLKTAPMSVEDHIHIALQDDGMPTNDAKFSTPQMLKAGPAAYLDPMFSSAAATQTFDAEYENVPEEQSEAQPEPARAGASAVDVTEQHRLDMVKKVTDKINGCTLDPSELVVKIGMPISMVNKQNTDELMRIYKLIP